MKALKLISIFAAVSLLAGAVMAQRGGMMMRGGDSSGLMQLQRPDVQIDLALTDDQKSKLKAMQDGARDKMREIFQNAGGDQDAMRAGFTKFQEDMKKEAAEILGADKMARLRQINIQLSGNRALMFPDVQKELSLSDAQKAKLTQLQEQQGSAMQGLFQKMRDGDLTREEMQDAMQKNNKIMDDELAKVLTADQKTKLTAIGGKEFKADPNYKPGGFGGGGGR